MPAGRKTIMTESVLQKLEQAFALDATDEEACAYADIAPATLYNYQVKYPEFLERKNKLKQLPYLTARKAIVDRLDSDPDFALKYMERKKKSEFSLRHEYTGAEGQDLMGGLAELLSRGENYGPDGRRIKPAGPQSNTPQS